ncbi:septum formation initiator family protein [Paenarthrobacter nicotinovorans]|uniref:Septum formation initiator family protein n=1 Tax=Paenarthrobacter nicotinovorans TaxID=29320 RepID=A0ABV0GMA6_PAENI
MATRRPKVPRADALGPSSAGRSSSTARPASGTPAGETRPSETRPSGTRPSESRTSAGVPGTAPKDPAAAARTGVSGSGDVIKAEFGGARTTAKTSTPAGATKAPATGGGTLGPKSPVAGKTSTKKPTATNSKAADKTSGKSSDKSSGKQGTRAAVEHELDPVPAKAFSGRMLALAVVMIAITIMLAPTVKVFLEKRAEISALEAEIAGRKAEQTELNKQLSRWQDPNYVKQQARDRINMVMPGETGYWVFGGEEAAGTPGGRTGSGSSANPENLPWVDALWESIRRSATD